MPDSEFTPQSIGSLKGAQRALCIFLCILLILGIFTEIPYAFFQWGVLKSALEIIGVSSVAATMLSCVLVPFDTFIQIFLLTPIQTAIDLSGSLLEPIKKWKLLIFMFANLWLFTNFFSEALGIATVASGRARTIWVWMNFPFAMGAYNLLFTGDIFRGIDVIFKEKLPLKLFQQSKLMFFHALLMLLASIADWSIAAYYAGYLGATEILHNPSSANFWGFLSAGLSIVFMTCSQLPETFHYIYDPLIANKVNKNVKLSYLEKSLFSLWAMLRAACFGTLTGYALSAKVLSSRAPEMLIALPVVLGLGSAVLFGVFTHRAACQHGLNQKMMSASTADADRVGLRRFKKMLLASLFISMFQRRVQAIEFNVTTFAKDIDLVNAIAWMAWLLPEQAISYGLFLWRRVQDVAPERYEQLKGLGRACCYFPPIGIDNEGIPLLDNAGLNIQ